MKKFVSLISGILLTITYSFSQTNVPGGYVSGTWTTASSPYIIDGEITLDTTDLLTIEPGVNILFSGHYKFIIHGRLLAEGTETDSIHFTAQDTTLGWHGLRFDHTDLNEQDSSKLNYCRLDYGKAYGTTFIDSTGGAICCDSSSLLLINNSMITNNSSFRRGGGIHLNYSNILIKNSVIRHNINSWSGYGGGLACFYGGLKLQNVIIEDNRAIDEYGLGGGIYLNVWSPFIVELSDVEIRNNFAEGDGGGIFTDNHVVNLKVNNCNIYNNEASGFGGGIYGDINTISSVEFNIFNNSAILGGGMLIRSGDGNIANMNIYDNSAEVGGGILLYKCNNLKFTKILIYGNSAIRGAGVSIDSSVNTEFRNVTVSENYATNNGGSFRMVKHSDSFLTGCILFGNTPDEISNDVNSEASMQYSLIAGGYPGLENIDADPLFADPEISDFSLTWSHFPEADSTKSPCIDTGDPLIIDPDGTRSDMGAIHFEQTFSPIPSGDISGTLSCAGSPYYVFGDISVPLGEELIIEPCVYVVFQGDYSFTVYGRLLAEGTETDRITFYPADTITGWGGIRFYDQNTNGQDSSRLVHCRVMYGNADVLYSQDGNGGGVYLNNSSDVLIDNSRFFGNRAITSGGAIYLSQSSPDIRNSVFENNSALNGGAVCCYDNVNTTLLNCNFSNNLAEDGGAFVVSSCAPGFSSCSMTNNRATRFGGAIYHDASGAPTFDNLNRCNIYDNYANYAGLDFYTTAGYITPPVLDIYLDTASVALMNEHFAYPFQYFNIISNSGRFVQEDSDLYVSTSGSDLNSGTSVSDPLKTIKMALIKIVADIDNPKNIHIAEGIYSNSKTGETLPINHRSHVTLSGDNSGNTWLEGDSLYRIMVSYADINDSVKKLSFKHGFKDGSGGAVVIENNSNPVFLDVSFNNNYSTDNGGAIWCFNECNPIFSEVYFLSNNSGNSGGAVYFHENDTILMNNIFINTNKSLNAGGGIYAGYYKYFRIIGGSISFNELINGSGGGAMFRVGPVYLEDLWINGNTIIGSGGGIYADYDADMEINSCTFSYNEASVQGGGLYFWNGVDINMEDVFFYSNSSVEGGAIRGYYQSTLDINNGLFFSNYTIYDPFNSGDGGALSLNDMDANLINVTITSNVSDGNGGGLYCWASSNSYNYSVKNSIIYGNSTDQVYIDYNAEIDIDYSDIEGGWLFGIGNINLNPDFEDPGSSDFGLNPGSPCINAGELDTTGMNLPIFDLAGKPRISNDTIDMGGYEFFEGIELDLKVFLEGPFNGTTMNTNLTSHPEPCLLVGKAVEGFPVQQPYNTTPWNYSGTEEVTTIPFDNVVDWILVEVRDTTDVSLANPESVVGRQAVFLMDDGSLRDINGNNIKFGNPIDHQCFITLFHRNHLGVISASPLTKSGGIYSYDFTTPAGQAFGTNAQKDLGSGIYGLYAGDADANDTIELDDKTLFWSIEAGSSGYLNSDFNLDSQTDNRDKNDFWKYNTGNSSQIPD